MKVLRGLIGLPFEGQDFKAKPIAALGLPRPDDPMHLQVFIQRYT